MSDSTERASSASDTTSDAVPPRRRFFGTVGFWVMASGLVASYGTLIAYAGRFLFPASRKNGLWQFVAAAQDLALGQSLAYKTPAGARIVIARQGEGDTADDFVALSSVCPHLGCSVHWESQNDRFFCPCHNGAFDASGKATEGPPAAAHQQLTRFPLKVEKGLLYIEISADTVTQTRKV